MKYDMKVSVALTRTLAYTECDRNGFDFNIARLSVTNLNGAVKHKRDQGDTHEDAYSAGVRRFRRTTGFE